MDAPAEYGGGGLSAFEAVVFWEEACKHRFCFPIAGGGAFGHSPPVVLYAGTPEQIDTWVRPAIAEGMDGLLGGGGAGGRHRSQRRDRHDRDARPPMAGC